MENQKTIIDYVAEIQEAQNAEWESHKYDMAKVPTHEVATGKKFFKVIRTAWGNKSVHCFVEIATGDIYKAASWNVPAKGVRGNINDEKKPLLCGQFYR